MSMKQFLSDIRHEVEAGWVNEKTLGDLSLFNYSKECQLAGHWNKITRQCRGLIIDTKTMEIVARPFKKFFNLNENDWSTLDKFPLWDEIEAVEVTDKMDGSLGIITKYNGELLVATRGSFESDQAGWAHDFIKESWNLDEMTDRHTYLAEIIYPENRVVVDYEGMKDVVLLGIVHTDSGYELPRNEVERHAELLGANLVDMFECKGFDHLLDLKQKLDFNTEGWVVHFLRTNQRVKIKTDDYMRLHRLISNLSPLAMWESMVDGKVDPEYLKQIPEEFKAEVQWMQDTLEEQYDELRHQIDSRMLGIKTKTGCHNPQTKAHYKTLALHIQEIKSEVVKKGCFARMRGKPIDDVILKHIRPDSNTIKNLDDTTTELKDMMT